VRGPIGLDPAIGLPPASPWLLQLRSSRSSMFVMRSLFIRKRILRSLKAVWESVLWADLFLREAGTRESA
jgi:hypothetical protein